MGCPDDIADWVEEMSSKEAGLQKRNLQLRKNLSAAIADAVMVAEIIHCNYPKIIQMHSYTEQSNAAGRLSNWRHLNSKVLRLLRCELTDEQMNGLSTRRSDDEVVDFLRELRVKLISFEPIYCAEYVSTHTGSMVAQQSRITAKLSTRAPSRVDATLDSELPPAPIPSPARSTSVSQSNLSQSTAQLKQVGSAVTPAHTPINDQVHSRRPSMMKSEKLLEAKKGKEEAARRAATMMAGDIDSMYNKIKTNLKRQTESIAAETQELEKQSYTLDAQLSALKIQNESELRRTEKRLSVLRLELAEAEQGQSVAVDNEVHYGDMYDPTKSSSFARELSQNLKEVAQSVSSLDDALGESSRRKSIKQSTRSPSKLITDTAKGFKQMNGVNDQESDISEEYESEYEDDEEDSEDEEDENDEESDEDPPPPPPPRPSSAALNQPSRIEYAPDSSVAAGPKLPIDVYNDQSLTKIPFKTQRNSDQMPVEFAHQSTTLSSQKPASNTTDQMIIEANYRRVYDKNKSQFYYVNLENGESKWRAPTEGVVLCVDKSNREYFFDVATGKSTWKT